MKTILIVGLLLVLSAPAWALPAMATGLMINGGSVDYTITVSTQVLPDAWWPVYADVLYREDAWAGGLCTPLVAIPDKLGMPISETARMVLERTYVGGLVERDNSGKWDAGFYARWDLAKVQF
jgi:hypothetical protein